MTTQAIRCNGGLRIGTDFSGMETPAWALKLLNVEAEHVFSCDKESHCRQVSKYVGSQNIFSDVKKRVVAHMPKVDLYIFGPPCVHCSPMGNQLGVSDPNNGDLIMAAMEYIQHHKPLAFIMEEVPEFATLEKQRQVFWLCVDNWRKQGYLVEFEILESSRFGVSQRRRRLYVVGILAASMSNTPLSIPRNRGNGSRPIPLTEQVDVLPQEKFQVMPDKPGVRQDNVKHHLERLAFQGVNPFTTPVIITAGASKKRSQAVVDTAPTITKAEVVNTS